jgi:hypothetical protein
MMQALAHRGLFSPLESRGRHHGATVMRGMWKHAARRVLCVAKHPMLPKAWEPGASEVVA